MQQHEIKINLPGLLKMLGYNIYAEPEASVREMRLEGKYTKPAQKKAIAAIFERIEVNEAGEIKGRTTRVVPAFVILQSLLSTGDIECPQGNLTTQYVAALQWPCTIYLEDFLGLMAA